MIVLFPDPLSPTSPTFSLELILKLIPFKTQWSFLLGYLNQTFLNSISPFNVSTQAIILLFPSSLISILLGSSIISKILLAASSPFAADGPNYCAKPAANAPNIIQKMQMKISVAYILWSTSSYINLAADQNRMQ